LISHDPLNSAKVTKFYALSDQYDWMVCYAYGSIEYTYPPLLENNAAPLITLGPNNMYPWASEGLLPGRGQ